MMMAWLDKEKQWHIYNWMTKKNVTLPLTRMSLYSRQSRMYPYVRHTLLLFLKSAEIIPR